MKPEVSFLGFLLVSTFWPFFFFFLGCETKLVSNIVLRDGVRRGFLIGFKMQP